MVTWLGENNDGLEDILHALCKVHCYSLRHDLGFRLIINKSCRGGRKIKRLFPSACLEEDVVLASRLFEYPYFSREWVFQEVLVSKQTAFRCGSSMISWDCIDDFFFALPHLMSSRRQPFSPGYNGFIAPFTLRIVGRNLKELTTDTSLFGLLELSEGMQVTDPRDSVFEVFNMVRNEGQRLLTADYRWNIQQTFVHTAYCPLENGDMDRMFDVAISQSRSYELPTRIPNWTSSFSRLNWAKHRQFNAVKSVPLQLSRTSRDYTLVLRGIRLSTVMHSLPFEASDESSHSFCDDRSWRRLVNLIAVNGRYQYNDEPLHKAFTRTRLGDSWASSAIAEPVKLSEDNESARKSLPTPKKRVNVFNVYEQARLRCEGKTSLSQKIT